MHHVPFDRPDGEPEKYHEEYHSGSGRKEESPRALLTLDEVFRVLLGHRYEILTIIALYGPIRVTEIAQRLDIVRSVVSRELKPLRVHGLLEWMRVKNSHIYRLTRHVHAFKWYGKLQFNLELPNGDWILVNREEFSQRGHVVRPPHFFLDVGWKTGQIPEGPGEAESVRQEQEWTGSPRETSRYGREETPKDAVAKRQKPPRRVPGRGPQEPAGLTPQTPSPHSKRSRSKRGSSRGR